MKLRMRCHFFNFRRIVGRAAFTGNHQWILSNNYAMAVHPPEVHSRIFIPELTRTELTLIWMVYFLRNGL